MSNLLSQASLVMIPSGYKEDVVYSQIPTNGNGDLSFTRASNGTRINSAGLVEVVPWNLLLDTDTFSSWNLEGGTLTSGFTAPDGSSTAYKYVQTTGGLYSGFSTATSGVKTASIWLKSVSGTSITCNLSDGDSSNVTVVSVTGDWQLFTATYTTSTSRPSLYIYSISNASGIYVWHPQLNIGSTAKPYFPTTDRLNVPRLTYQNGGGGCPSLLLEPQTTALNQFSESFDNAYWQLKTDVTIEANTTATLDPAGDYGAEKITETATTARHRVAAGSATLSAVNHTASVFMKKGTARYGFVTFAAGAIYTIIVDLEDGTITATSTSGTIVAQKVEDYGNGWYRISVTGLSGLTGSTQYALQFGSAGSAVPSSYVGNIPSFAGSTSNYLYAWGANLTATSYLQSYIPTTSSSATRVADACFKTGISSLIGSTTGSVFVDFEIFTTSGFGGIIEIINTSSTGQRLLLWENASTSLELNIGGGIGGASIGTTATIGRHKAVFTYTASAIKFFLDGVKIGQTTPSTLTGGFDKLDFEHSQGGVFIQKKNINQALVFTSELTEAEAIALTTI